MFPIPQFLNQYFSLATPVTTKKPPSSSSSEDSAVAQSTSLNDLITGPADAINSEASFKQQSQFVLYTDHQATEQATKRQLKHDAIRALLKNYDNTDGETYYKQAISLFDDKTSSSAELNLGVQCLHQAYRKKHTPAIHYLAHLSHLDNEMGHKCGIPQGMGRPRAYLEVAFHCGDQAASKKAAEQIALLYLGTGNIKLAKEWCARSYNDIAPTTTTPITTEPLSQLVPSDEAYDDDYRGSLFEALAPCDCYLWNQACIKKLKDIAFSDSVNAADAAYVLSHLVIERVGVDERNWVGKITQCKYGYLSEQAQNKLHSQAAFEYGLVIDVDLEHKLLGISYETNSRQAYERAWIQHGHLGAKMQLDRRYEQEQKALNNPFEHPFDWLNNQISKPATPQKPVCMMVKSNDDLDKLVKAKQWENFLATSPTDEQKLWMLRNESFPSGQPIVLNDLDFSSVPSGTVILPPKGVALVGYDDPNDVLCNTSLQAGLKLKKLGPAFYEQAFNYFLEEIALDTPRDVFESGIKHFLTDTLDVERSIFESGWTSEADRAPRAIFELGKMYARGQGTEQNYAYAIACFQSIIDTDTDDNKAKSPELIGRAHYELGKLFALGLGSVMDDNGVYYQKAKNHFECAKAVPIPEAMNELGKMLMLGHGTLNRTNTYQELHCAAHTHNVPEAWSNLGLWYERNTTRSSRENNQEEALTCYRKAQALHDPVAMVHGMDGAKLDEAVFQHLIINDAPAPVIADAYAKLAHQCKDDEKKLALYLNAIRYGSPYAFQNVARCYAVLAPTCATQHSAAGDAKKTEYTFLSKHYYRRHVELTFDLRQGMAPIDNECRSYYGEMSRTASPNLPNFKINQPQCYFNEYGYDYSRLHRFWQAKADKGDSRAVYNLGMLYLEGKGVEKNKVNFQQGVSYLEQAAALGNQEAIDTLKHFELIFWRPLPSKQLENAPLVS